MKKKMSLTEHQRICKEWSEIRYSGKNNGSDKVHALLL